MNKKVSFLSLVLISLLLLGCSKSASSSDLATNIAAIPISVSSIDLINAPESIDKIIIQAVSDQVQPTYKEITGKEKIEKLFELIKDIEVKKLSLAREREILPNPEAYAKKVEYLISLESTTNEQIQPNGVIVVFNDGNLLFGDQTTMVPEEKNKAKRTVSYLSTKKQEKVINQISQMLNITGASTTTP